jgi:hypothetical protein
MLRQKHHGSISEFGEQIDMLNKLKAKSEKETRRNSKSDGK